MPVNRWFNVKHETADGKSSCDDACNTDVFCYLNSCFVLLRISIDPDASWSRVMSPKACGVHRKKCVLGTLDLHVCVCVCAKSRRCGFVILKHEGNKDNKNDQVYCSWFIVIYLHVVGVWVFSCNIRSWAQRKGGANKTMKSFWLEERCSGVFLNWSPINWVVLPYAAGVCTSASEHFMKSFLASDVSIILQMGFIFYHFTN